MAVTAVSEVPKGFEVIGFEDSKGKNFVGQNPAMMIKASP